MGRFSKLELRDAPAAEPAAGAARDYAPLADGAFRRGEYELALRYYSRALADDGRRLGSWVGQVLCLINLGEFAEAVTWADRALGSFPQSADLTAAKAVAHGRAGDLERALAYSDKSLRLGECGAFVWWARGDILIATNPQNARFAFTKALELGRGDASLHFAIGKTWLSVGQPGEARRHLLRAEQLDADNPVIWHYLGLAYKELGLTSAARAAFEHALSGRSGLAETRKELEALAPVAPLQRAWAGVRRIFS